MKERILKTLFVALLFSFYAVAANAQVFQRSPTPPMPGPAIDIGQLPPCDPNTGCCPTEIAAGQGGSWMPWRKGVEDTLASQKDMLQQILANQKSQQNQPQQPPTVDVQVGPNLEEATPAKPDDISPLYAGLCVLAAAGVGIVLFYVAGKG